MIPIPPAIHKPWAFVFAQDRGFVFSDASQSRAPYGKIADMNRGHPVEIALVVALFLETGRSYLRGVKRYLLTSGPKNARLRLVQAPETPAAQVVSTLRALKPDGIICSEMEQRPVAACLERSTVPLVVIGSRKSCIPRRVRAVSFVSVDERALAAFAADRLLGLGNFPAYCYTHHPNPDYAFFSKTREEVFLRLMASHGKRTFVFPTADYPPAQRIERLLRWLDALPKPAAILSGNENAGLEIIDACRRLALSVPGDVSLVTYGCDPILCTSATPQFTGIHEDCERVGFEAMRELHRLLRQRDASPAGPNRIMLESHPEMVERESSRAVPPGLHLVEAGKRFIAAHAGEDIGVGDVVAHLGVSRRLANLRFLEFEHVSIHELIVRTRLERVRAMLKEDSRSIAAVSRACGFTNLPYLKTLFKRRFGMTMGDYRQS